MGEKTETTAVIVVGGGPSGLATAAYLHQLSIPHILLEREDCFAPLWQKFCYDRVHLHLDKKFCELPLSPIPKHFPAYLSRNEFVEYLNNYVSRFQIAPRYGRRVDSAAYGGEEWKVEAENVESGEIERYRSRFLVVATGGTCDARIPLIEGLGSFTGEVLHSTAYKNGGRFSGKKVLVVGSGNSGMEIALDLASSGAKTSIVVRSPVHVLSKRMLYIALEMLKYYVPMKWIDILVTMMSKVVFGDLTKYGIRRPEEGPLYLKIKYGKYPVVDVGTVRMIKSGEIKVVPGIRSIKGNMVLFENGKGDVYDAIVMATGFKRSTKE